MQHILDTARKYIGLKEVKGPGHNLTIVGWIKRFGKNLGRWGRSRDETAWCAIFVSKVLHECGYRGTDHALASKYIRWGKPAKITPGAVVVIKRKKKGGDRVTGSHAGYHVGFLVRLTKHYIVLLGGNQRDSVRVSYFSRKGYLIMGIRQPSEL